MSNTDSEKLILEVIYLEHNGVKLRNSKGDTFTFNPLTNKGLASFIHNADQSELTSALASRDYYKELAEAGEKVIETMGRYTREYQTERNYDAWKMAESNYQQLKSNPPEGIK